MWNAADQTKAPELAGRLSPVAGSTAATETAASHSAHAPMHEGVCVGGDDRIVASHADAPEIAKFMHLYAVVRVCC
jgi:hypothetical protein